MCRWTREKSNSISIFAASDAERIACGERLYDALANRLVFIPGCAGAVVSRRVAANHGKQPLASLERQWQRKLDVERERLRRHLFLTRRAGSVTLNVNASGATNDALLPHMNLVVADTKVGFDVAAGFNNYQHTFNLPAGTYFVRSEFNNDVPTANRQLTIGSLEITRRDIGEQYHQSNH